MKLKSNASVWKFFILLGLALFLSMAKKSYAEQHWGGLAEYITIRTTK